jgi:hypothetical protein
MKEVRLTKKGKDLVKVTSQERNVILDFLYENGPTTMDRLLGLDGNARLLVRELVKKGLVEEVRE